MEWARKRPAELRGSVVGGFDQDGVHLHVAFGDFEARGQAVEKFLDDALAVHADHAAVGPVMPTSVM